MIDSHCHLDHEPLFRNINEVINNAKKSGVKKLLTISTTLESYERILKILSIDPMIYGTIGIHPHESSKDIVNYEPLSALKGGQDGLDIIKRVIYKSVYLLKMSGLIAIEIGDNQYKKVSRILRQKGFREISKEYDYNRNVRCIISTKIRFL